MVNPFDFGLVGSRGTYAVGSAIIGAAEDALQKLYAAAAPKLDADAEELETVDGRIFVRGNPDRAISWSKAIGIMHTITGFGSYEADYSVPNFIMLFVEVEVDTGTGLVRIRKVVTATDVGQVIDPPSLQGQLYGALGSAGLDTAVFEETVIDTNSGHMLNMNMSDYKWRTFADLPEFENVILETPFPTHRFKAIGVGEVATAPAPGAVLMAVSNAVGKHLHHYPLTPDRILEALGKVRSRNA
jgi:xanthine dehydrogenase molybdenum-binding subunit